MYALPASRRTTWNPGLSYSGGIPDYTTVHATIGAPAGDMASTVQAALNSAGSAAAANLIGRVVRLGDGIYDASSELVIPSRVVLRGAGLDANGAMRTTIRYTGTDGNVVRMGQQWYPNEAGSTGLAATAAKGSTTIQVANASGFTAGTWILIDELTDDAIVWWHPDKHPLGQNRNWYNRDNRPISQFVQIASVAGNTITLARPLHTDFRTAFSAQIVRFQGPMTTLAGVEDLRVTRCRGTKANIYFNMASRCWARRCEADDSIGSAVGFELASQCEVRDSYLHDSGAPYPGGNGYAFDVRRSASDNLIENNISIRFNKVVNFRASGGGNVVAYNYMDDGYINYAMDWVETGLQASHYPCNHYELFEGNCSFNAAADATEGNAVHITYFRNHLSGERRKSVAGMVDGGSVQCAGAMTHHLWYNYVGNVLGKAGVNYATWIQDQRGPWSAGDKAIWRFGTWDQNYSTNDSQVAATAIRDGNFDYKSNSVQWLGLGGAGSTPDTLPDSLYLTSRPAFVAPGLAWPWVDPAGATKTAILPAKARYDAGLPLSVTDYPSPMPIISRAVPASSSAGTASFGQDDNYVGIWWGESGGHEANIGATGWLAYNLSGVPAAQRRSLLVALYMGDGTQYYTLNFRNAMPGDTAEKVPLSYVLEGAASASGPWTALVTVTTNANQFKSHLIADFTPYTFLRFRSVTGAPDGCALKMDVYDASSGVTDGIVFYGDSITANTFSGGTAGMPPEWYSKPIRAAVPSFFPFVLGGGYPFMNAADAVDLIVNGGGSYSGGLPAPLRTIFPGAKYAALVFGANDAPSPDAVTAFRSRYTTIINALRAQGQTVVVATPTWAATADRQAGLRQIRGAIGFQLSGWQAGSYNVDAYVWNAGRAYRCTTSGTSVSGPSGTGSSIADGGTARWAYTASLREDYIDDPAVIGGPDLYAVFENHPEWVGDAAHPEWGDGLHPNEAGTAQWRNAWVAWALSSLYVYAPAEAPTPPDQVAHVAHASLGATATATASHTGTHTLAALAAAVQDAVYQAPAAVVAALTERVIASILQDAVIGQPVGTYFLPRGPRFGVSYLAGPWSIQLVAVSSAVEVAALAGATQDAVFALEAAADFLAAAGVAHDAVAGHGGELADTGAMVLTVDGAVDHVDGIQTPAVAAVEQDASYVGRGEMEERGLVLLVADAAVSHVDLLTVAAALGVQAEAVATVGALGEVVVIGTAAVTHDAAFDPSSTAEAGAVASVAQDGVFGVDASADAASTGTVSQDAAFVPIDPTTVAGDVTGLSLRARQPRLVMRSRGSGA